MSLSSLEKLYPSQKLKRTVYTRLLELGNKSHIFI
jgi:hypothetical protein